MHALVDIHAHVLPGIDDGPPDLAQSLRLLHVAERSGIDTLAATPHLRRDFPTVRVEELARRVADLRSAAKRAGLGVRVVGGAEVSLSWALEASEEQLRLASFDQGGRDLLIETPTSGLYGIEHALFTVGGRGFRITLAHPERAAAFDQAEVRLAQLAEQGVLLQVNADSLLGSAGPGVRRLARRLCRQGIAHALASDAHRGAGWRPVDRLALGAEALARLVGEQRALWMTQAVPAAILAGEPLPPPPVKGAWRRGLSWRRR